MNVIKTDIEGVLIIEPRLFRDFFESFSEREFKEKADGGILIVSIRRMPYCVPRKCFVPLHHDFKFFKLWYKARNN